MKNLPYFCFLFVAIFVLSNLYAAENFANELVESASKDSTKSVNEMSFFEFEKSLKSEFLQDGTKFSSLLLKYKNKPVITIMGDTNKGANIFVFNSILFISKDELAKILPELKSKSKIKNSPCIDFIENENSGNINANEFKSAYIRTLSYLYIKQYISDVLDLKFNTLPQKLVLVLDLKNIISANEKVEYFLDNAIKSYGEIKEKNLIPDILLLRFVFELKKHIKDEDEKAYFDSEAIKLLASYIQKYEFDILDDTLNFYFTEQNPEIKSSLKNFILSGFKNSSNISIDVIYQILADVSGQQKISNEDLMFLSFLLDQLNQNESFLKNKVFAGDLKQFKIDIVLLTKNPDYKTIADDLVSLQESPHNSLRLAYVFEKSGSQESLKKSEQILQKLKENKSYIPSPFLVTGIFSKDYVKFIVKNFGIDNYLNFFAWNKDAKELFANIKDDLNLTKEEIIKVKMHGFISDIAACEGLETKEQRQMAFEILSGYVQNDKNCANIGFLSYVLFCHCEGRNTEKNVEKAKSILNNYISNIESLKYPQKSKALNSLSELTEEPRNTFANGKLIEIKLPEEIISIVKSCEERNQTATYCINQSKKFLAQNNLKAAFEFYKEAVNKDFKNTFELIDTLKSLSKDLSDEDLINEVNLLARIQNEDYYNSLLECRILGVFTEYQKYNALVKYLNSSKRVKPFIKDEIFAILYQKGLGVEKNSDKSNELFKKAESLSEENLRQLVDFVYENGFWNEAQISRKDFLNTLLIEKNPDDINSILNLAGTSILSPKETEKIKRADRLYQMAIHSPKYNGQSFIYIYRFYALENRPSTDFKKAFELAEIVSKKADPYERIEALERLATHYLCGIGVEKDENKAVEILKEIIKLCETNDSYRNENTTAYAVLIYCIENEIAGLKNDSAEIEKLYKKISKNTIFDTVASFRSRESSNKNRTPVDREFATKFLNECKKRNIHIEDVLYTLYRFSTENKNYDVPEYRDEKLAWQTLLEMEKLNIDPAVVKIRKAHHLLAGVGVAQNTQEALKLLNELEISGSKINVNLTLAYAYENGIGVGVDKEKSEECKKKLKALDFVKNGGTITEYSIRNGYVLPFDRKWMEEQKRNLKN